MEMQRSRSELWRRVEAQAAETPAIYGGIQLGCKVGPQIRGIGSLEGGLEAKGGDLGGINMDQD